MIVIVSIISIAFSSSSYTSKFDETVYQSSNLDGMIRYLPLLSWQMLKFIDYSRVIFELGLKIFYTLIGVMQSCSRGSSRI